MGVTSNKFNVINSGLLPTIALDGVPYFTKDTNELYVGTGEGIVKVDTGHSPKIINVDADVTSVQFTGLDLLSDVWYKLVSTVKAINSAYNIYLYFNGNTTAANYTSQKSLSTGNKFTVTSASAPILLDVLANGITWTTTNIDILGGYPVFRGYGVRNGSEYLNSYGGRLSSITTNVTSITITAAVTKGIKAGSIFELYKR